jgi:hypothetical protein
LVTMIFYSCLPFGKSHGKNGNENITSSQCLSSEGSVMLTLVGAIAFIGVSEKNEVGVTQEILYQRLLY